MITPVPVPPTPVAGGYQKENTTFTDLTGAYRSMNVPNVRISKNSPPLVGVDVQEGQLIIDRTTNKLHVVVNGVLKGVSLT
jgi:hypothetical protein